MNTADRLREARAGFFYALSAYTLWGFLPLYMRAMDHIPALEIVAHRAFWSLPFAALVLWWLGRTADIVPALKDPKKFLVLIVTATVIALNWGVYVWAISVDRTIETALGYYINPLISVALGVIFLKERFTRAQLIAISIALIAVIILTIQGGKFPWISLVLAFSFAAYGLLRKTVDVGPTQGFMVEVILLAPVALAYLVWLQTSGGGLMFTGSETFWLLVGCGPVTAVPLILYAFGAKRLKLATLGLMQYIAPTLIFLIGLFVFREPFSQTQFFAFLLIWTALAIYSWSAVTGQRKMLRRQSGIQD